MVVLDYSDYNPTSPITKSLRAGASYGTLDSEPERLALERELMFALFLSPSYRHYDCLIYPPSLSPHDGPFDCLCLIALPPCEEVPRRLTPTTEDIYQFLVCVGNICIYALIGGIIGSLAIPFIIAVFPCLLGFSVAGIVSGSPAAFLMAQHQGYVPVDSFVARMQSLGQQGWRAGFNSVNMIVGGALGLFFGAFVAVYVQDVCSS